VVVSGYAENDLQAYWEEVIEECNLREKLHSLKVDREKLLATLASLDNELEAVAIKLNTLPEHIL
ncbi:12714_t:CDS:2, partial [Ambispora gerdemannii]